MNKERLLKLAEHLERPEVADHYNQGTFSSSRPVGRIMDCGSAGCVAGHAMFLFGSHSVKATEKICNNAEKLLDLSGLQAYCLFWFSSFSPTNIQAARVVRHLAETGIVDWNI